MRCNSLLEATKQELVDKLGCSKKCIGCDNCKHSEQMSNHLWWCRNRGIPMMKDRFCSKFIPEVK